MSSRNVVCALMLACGFSAQAQMEAMPQPKLASVYLVKITDMVNVESYEVLSREEVAALQKAISEESRVFNAAMIAVKKAWDEDELTKGTAFPSSAFSVRKMQQQGPFSEEQANKKMEQAIDRDNAALVREQEREKKKREEEKKKREEDRKKGIPEKKPSAKELEREAKRETALRNAQEKVMAKMAELLKRDVPKSGL